MRCAVFTAIRGHSPLFADVRVARLSRRKQGFESPRERVSFQRLSRATSASRTRLPTFCLLSTDRIICACGDVRLRTITRAPDYESGGQEFESLRARH